MSGDILKSERIAFLTIQVGEVRSDILLAPEDSCCKSSECTKLLVLTCFLVKVALRQDLSANRDAAGPRQ